MGGWFSAQTARRWDILWPDVSTIFYCRLIHHNSVVFFVIWWCWWFSALPLPRQSSEGQPGPSAAKRVLWPSPVSPEWSVWGGRGAGRRPRSKSLTLAFRNVHWVINWPKLYIMLAKRGLFPWPSLQMCTYSPIFIFKWRSNTNVSESTL